MAAPRLLEVPIFRDERGYAGVVQGDSLPFAVQRFYFLGDVPSGQTRGHHAHRALEQVIVALSGQVVITLDDGRSRSEYRLDGPSVGLYVPPGYWRVLSDFTAHAVIGVLASLPFDEADYIRRYEDFLEWSRAR